MNAKKFLFGIFALIILAVPAYIIFKSEDVLAGGNKHILHTIGFDPVDKFRGHYLDLNYDDIVLCDEDLKKGDQAYVVLEKDSLGFSYFAFAESEKPDHSDYFICKLKYAQEKARLDLNNIKRYYINEDKVERAEDIVQDYTRNRPNDIWVEVSVLDGEIRMVDLFIEGTPILEFLDNTEE
ncbi:MAG: GDYXXLXY domain-containing protein [Crocinitomicaceae bacterium]|nr:GDYXXLXY domain-containing protein [Crocinitomicaceae bacterium]